MYRTLNAFCAASCGLLLGATVGILLIPSPSKAAEAVHTGEVAASCALTVNSDGVLAYGTNTLDSTSSGGSPASITTDVVGTGYKARVRYNKYTKDGSTVSHPNAWASWDGGANWTQHYKAFGSAWTYLDKAVNAGTSNHELDIKVQQSAVPGTYSVSTTVSCVQ